MLWSSIYTVSHFPCVGHNCTSTTPHSRRNLEIWACLWYMDVPLRTFQFVDLPKSAQSRFSRSYCYRNVSSMCCAQLRYDHSQISFKFIYLSLQGFTCAINGCVVTIHGCSNSQVIEAAFMHICGVLLGNRIQYLRYSACDITSYQSVLQMQACKAVQCVLYT